MAGEIVLPSVYVETSVIGYLTSWPRKDVTVAGHQRTTRTWWATATDRFELFVSQPVIDECSEGDQDAVLDRLDCIRALSVLPTTAEAESLANELMCERAVPSSEPRDALHIALAAVHGVEFLVSWNFRHIVNASLRPVIERVCRDNGHEPPILCTPEELRTPEQPTMEDDDDQ
jgi:predicted nucleic acid-binding protein